MDVSRQLGWRYVLDQQNMDPIYYPRTRRVHLGKQVGGGRGASSRPHSEETQHLEVAKKEEEGPEEGTETEYPVRQEKNETMVCHKS